MASKVPDDPPFNTQETDEETVAFRKKRSRRVSFADREITSVHIFKRDEDYETPPDSTPRPASDREKEVIGLFRDLVDSDDSNGGDDDEDEDDDVLSARKSFLRPMESPSPGGSSTVGSAATSNDEDNFFGPVSANFIRPGRLSDSAASDDNHDITMDSTAFSMHFRSIVRSESGDLTTSTGDRLASEEKTPFQVTTPSDPENLMVLTKVKKLKSPSPVLINKFSGGRDSNDMSFVGESLHRYDYGRLSPTLEALLAEGSKEYNAINASDSTTPKLSSIELAISHDNENDCIKPLHYGNSGPLIINNHDIPDNGASIAQNKVAEATGDSTSPLINQIMHDNSLNPRDDPVAEDFVDHQTHTPKQLTKGKKDIAEVMSGTSVNSELHAVSAGTPLNQSSDAVQVDLFKQFEYGNQPLTIDGVKANSPRDEIHTSNVGHALNQTHGSPLAGSIHSISAKRLQILLDTTNSPRRALFVTPSPKHPGSILSKGSIKQGGSVPPILKSNPKLKILEPSPSASAFNDGIVKSKLRLSGALSSRASPYNTFMEELGESFQCQQANVPIINLEEHLSSVDLEKGKVDCNGLGTPKNIGSLIQDGGTAGLGKAKDYNDKSMERMATITSPSKFTHSGKKVKHHSLTSVDSVDGTLVASTLNTSPLEITFEISEDKRDNGRVYKLDSPTMDRLNQKLSSATKHQASLSGNSKLQDQDNSTIFVSGRECNLVEKVPSNNYLTPTAESRTHSGSSLVKINSLKDFSILKSVDEKESNGLDVQNTPETLRNFPDEFALKQHLGSREKYIQTATEPPRSSEQKKVSSAYASFKSGKSPRKSPLKNKQTQSPTSKEPSWSLCRKELHGVNMQLSAAKDVVSLNCSSTLQRVDDCHQRFAQNPTPAQDIQNSSKRKRTSEEVALSDVHYADKHNIIQQSSKFHKVGENLEHMLEYDDGSDNANDRIEDGKTLKNWTDISLKLSADTSQLLSPSFDKPNINVINMMEDILLHQQKVNLCEMLCSEIQSHLCSAYDQSNNIRHKRVAETRPLLYRIVCEKAKLQLMHVKRERLLKQVQLLRTRVQESQILKLNCVKHLKDNQLDDNSRSVRFGGNVEGYGDKVTTMRDDAEALEKKIKNLTKSFHIYCKIKGEPSCSDTIDLVNDHLKKRTCCRFIRQDMQLWEIDDLEKRNGLHNVVLNYHGFICQSLKLNTGSISSIIVVNKLNDINISKNFRNMDACSAFAFVFNHESTKKYVGAKSLAQETQRTSLLLTNLLDVLEEVQTAQLEIRNLTLTSFHAPSAEQLDLQLDFIDFDSGVKVMMTLDVTCLNCGVYPSEILPYQLQAPTTGTEKSDRRPLSAEIKAAVGTLRAGYSRIIRLCRCVSQAMQSSGR